MVDKISLTQPASPADVEAAAAEREWLADVREARQAVAARRRDQPPGHCPTCGDTVGWCQSWDNTHTLDRPTDAIEEPEPRGGDEPKGWEP